jgi:hypothetical protein
VTHCVHSVAIVVGVRGLVQACPLATGVGVADDVRLNRLLSARTGMSTDLAKLGISLMSARTLTLRPSPRQLGNCAAKS